MLTIDFPQYNSFFGQEIGVLLSGRKKYSSAMDLNPKAMCLWYALDRWKTLIDAEWEKYDYIIFNRYTLSSVVYQTARQFGALNWAFAYWIFELEHIQLQLPIPDLYIFLDTPVDDAKNNITKKEARSYTDGLDVYERSSDLLSSCQKIYWDLAEADENIQIVPCCTSSAVMLPKEIIQNSIIKTIKENELI